MSKNKWIAWGWIVAVFAANYLETLTETLVKGDSGVIPELGYRLAHAFQRMEGGLTFAFHEASNGIAVYGYSLVYFFLFPLLGLGLGIAFTLRRDDAPLRVLSRALAIDYAVSLPFFVLFPVPERWTVPGSGAMLLSDRWSSSLIETLRPISGLDNCFPSFHVSMTVVVVALAFVAGVRWRVTLAVLGATIVLSTFGLGIHWLPDIVAGGAVGVLSVALALRLEPERVGDRAAGRAVATVSEARC